MMRVTPPCRAESRLILSTCDRATPRRAIAWAVGVYQFGHAIDLRRPKPPLAGGHTLDNGRWYRGHEREGWSIYASIGGATVVRGKWDEVTALMHYQQLPAGLRAQVERAWATRRDRILATLPIRSRDHWSTPEGQREDALWTAIELRCYALAHLAWCHWRPTDADLSAQLDLFAEATRA